MEFLSSIVSFIVNIDVHLGQIISQYGTLSYAILFFIIFAETGLVVTPFLPGDSLLFAAGAFAARGSFNVFILCLILWIGAFLGDMANYWIGYYFGEKLVKSPRIPINQRHIDQTNAFYAKYGGKAIILARFVPIVRTFAPFVAGIGKMKYSKFSAFNAVGGLVWVFGVTLVGYFFGNIPQVQHNFSLVVFAIIGISVLPIVIELAKAKFSKLGRPKGI